MQTWTRWGVALAASAALTVAAGGAQAQNAAGDWHGTATGPFGTGTVGVTLKAKAGGGYEGFYVTAMLKDPLDEAKVDKGTLTFSTVHGSYTGRWDAARKAWVGQWTTKWQTGFVAGSPGAATAKAPSLPPLSLPPATPIDLVLTAGKP
jgi:nitrogen fixation protein FixH